MYSTPTMVNTPWISVVRTIMAPPMVISSSIH
jgi:hypothetical protein